jgi:hypothetical protein
MVIGTDGEIHYSETTSLLVLLPRRAQPQTTLIDTVILLCRSIRRSDLL